MVVNYRITSMDSILACIFGCSLFCPMAYADPSFYFGMNAGLMQGLKPGFSDESGYSLVLGRAYDQKSSIEWEYTTNANQGDVAERGSSSATPQAVGSWDLQSGGLYIVRRWGSRYYTTGKLGLIWVNANQDVSNDQESIGFGLLPSIGLGAGYRLTKQMNLELKYTTLDGDVDFIAAGIGYRL